jgi:hypothetical protein
VADEYIYRVTRVDTHKKYWHQPLKRVVNERSFQAYLNMARTYRRYKIVKVERAKISEFEDCTEEYVPTVQPSGS